MSWEDDIRHVPGIWFSKGGGSVVPVPPLAFFDTVPEELEFGLCSLYPFTQPDVLRKLVKSHPEVLDYLESHPVPGGTMERCLQWASPIGTILFRSDYSLLYCNHLTTCHTDEVELKRTIAGLPEDIVSYWPKDLLIHVCLGNDLNVQPVSRTWAELTMSHLTSGQRFGFSLPPVTPRESTEPTAPSDAEYEAEPAVRSGPKSAIQRELDKIAAGLTAEQERPARTPATTSPSRTLPPLSPRPASSAPASPSRTAINPLWLFLIGSGVTLCALLGAVHWQNSDRNTAKSADTKRGNSDDPVARLDSMTPAQAYGFGFGQIRPQYDQTMAAVQDDLYPGSVTNQMRRRGGKSELTPANVAEEMRKIYVEAARDPEVLAELRGEAAQAGVSEQVLDSYLQGQLTGTAALDRTDRQPPQAAESEQTRRPAPIASPSETIPSQQLAPDNQPLLETAISMCDVYGANEAHRAGLPSIKRDENGEWHITVPVKNIRDDQRQADSLGLMALLLAHTFSGQVNGAVVKCTMTGQTVSGLSEDLVTANSSNFQPESKAWLVHEDAFPAANQHGWAACHLASDPTMVSKEVVPLSPKTPVLRIFPVKQTSAGTFSIDDQTPLLTVYTLASIRWTGNKPTITLNDRDMIAYATITRKYSHDFLYFAANPDTGQVARIEGEITDGEIAFTKPEDEAIAACLRTRFPADEKSQNPVDNDQGFRLYVNKAQRYSVMVSALLAPTLRENASGDTVTAASEDGRVKLLLRVKQGVGTAETLYKQWTAEHTARDPGKIVDYKTFHGDWFVVSGHDGPRGYYVKVVVRGSESLFLCLEYDEEQSSRLGTMLTKISRSFTGGIDGLAGTAVQATPPAAPKPTQTRAVDANAQPVPAAGSLSRREWRERLKKYCTIPSGHQLLSNEKRLFAVMGKPDDVEHEGRNTYWYYKCSDGVVQLAFQLDPEMMGGQIIAEVSDR